MSILITGGCGLIGVNLTRALPEEHEEVAIFDVVPENQLPEDLVGRVKYIRGDITNSVEVLNTVKAIS